MNTPAQTSHKPPGRSLLINLLIVFISLLFVAILGEIGLRLLGDQSATKLSEMYPQGKLCGREPVLGWIGKPNTSGTLFFRQKDMEAMHVTMNADGFWDTEHEEGKKRGTKRILFLGDSFTAGYGISMGNRFTEIMKKSLPPNYEVINMGMWGYSTDQELLVLQEKGLKYSPDVVVLCLFMDDLFNSHLFSVNDGLYMKPKFNLTSETELILANVPTPNNRGPSVLLNTVLTRYFRLKNRMTVGSTFQKRGWWSVFDKAYLEEYRFTLPLRLIAEIHALSKDNKAEFLLVMIPYRDQLHEAEIYESKKDYGGIPIKRLDLSLPQKVVNLFCQKAGISVLDLLVPFKEYGSPENLFFKTDLHWTKEGHELVSAQVLSSLRKLDHM